MLVASKIDLSLEASITSSNLELQYALMFGSRPQKLSPLLKVTLTFHHTEFSSYPASLSCISSCQIQLSDVLLTFLSSPQIRRTYASCTILYLFLLVVPLSPTRMYIQCIGSPRRQKIFGIIGTIAP